MSLLFFVWLWLSILSISFVWSILSILSISVVPCLVSGTRAHLTRWLWLTELSSVLSSLTRHSNTSSGVMASSVILTLAVRLFWSFIILTKIHSSVSKWLPVLCSLRYFFKESFVRFNVFKRAAVALLVFSVLFSCFLFMCDCQNSRLIKKLSFTVLVK